MKRITITFFFLFIFLFITAFFPGRDEFEKKWKKVETLQQQGLPQSALKLVEEIYKEAAAKKDFPNEIKALIYKASLESTYQENHLEKAIQDFEKALTTASFPAKQLLYSLTAELYQQYFWANKWKILSIQETEENSDDISTWGARKFHQKIKRYYLHSLKPADRLAQINLQTYAPILKPTDKRSLEYRNTLYDLLAERAVRYFSSALYNWGNVPVSTEINPEYLLPAKRFMQLRVNDSTDTGIILKLYQQLLNLHFNDKNPVIFVDVDLKRLQFVYEQLPQTEENRMRYIKALENLYHDYQNLEVSAQPALALANEYIYLGNRYDPFNKETEKYHYYKVKALDLCQQVLTRFPHSKFAGNCKNTIQTLQSVSFSLEIEKEAVPGRPQLVRVSFKNLPILYLKVVKVTDPDNFFLKSASASKIDQKYLTALAITTKTVNLPDTKDLQQHTIETALPGLTPGVYVVLAADSAVFPAAKRVKSTVVTVTDLALLTSPENEQNRFLAVNRATGKPLKNVQGSVYKYVYGNSKRHYQKIYDFKTGKDGMASGPAGAQTGSALIKLQYKDQLLYVSDYLPFINIYKPKPTTQVYLFTDRSIYRPGQTVYFKGIVVEKYADSITVVPNYETVVTFKNTNYKDVASLKVKSNAFGSFYGAFVIPAGGLNGTMRLKTPKGTVTFRVENYKRPSFKVIFDTLTSSFKLNDTITLRGKAVYFNGFPVAGAEVSYRITRAEFNPFPFRFFIPFPPAPEVEITSGTLQTDEKGVFSVSFKAAADQDRAYLFNCYVNVKDITGEVQTGETGISISTKALWVKMDMPEKFNIQNDTIRLLAYNAAGKPLTVTGNLKIYRLQEPETTYIPRYWQKPDLQSMTKETFKKLFPHYAYGKEDEIQSWPAELVRDKEVNITGQTTLPRDMISKLPAGRYKLVLTAGKETDSLYSVIYDPQKKLPATHDVLWSATNKKLLEPDETLQTVVASAEKNTLILYQVIAGSTIVDEQFIRLSNKQKVIPFWVPDSLRGGFSVNLLTVKNNRYFSERYYISVPFTNKKLDIHLEAFRDHLTPGKKETWSVKVKDWKKENTTAELMAVMYDASLDVIKPHQWKFNLYHARTNSVLWKSATFGHHFFSDIRFPKQPHYEEFVITYPDINWFGLRFNSPYGDYLFAQTAPMAKSVRAEPESMENDIQEQKANVKPFPQKKEAAEPVETQIRSDFRETAFFYPQLETDSTGSAQFSFTVPDALTQWKLMLLAHTPDLKTGFKTQTFKAYKEIMILPNTPRFVRQNDRLEFSARVVNNSQAAQTITVNLVFSDPLNSKKLNLFLQRKSSEYHLSLTPGESKKVSWLIHIPDSINLLSYKITAASDHFSDGEQRLIPVLSNRMLVTETLPMLVHGKEAKTFVFQDFKKKHNQKGIKNYCFTLEFTSNPAWYAVQSLPYLNQPQTDHVSALFNTYFANTLSAYILHSSPKIKTVIESWKNSSPDAFLSQLQKNETLKSVVLEETPWVLEAESEAEQKRRIALLFDLNNLKNNQATVLQKLQRAQLPSGAWPWFKGMQEDRFTTQKIVSGLARLLEKEVIDLSDRTTQAMLKRAVYYLDQKQKKIYQKLKESPNVDMDKRHISGFDVEYLYARTLLKQAFPIQPEFDKVFSYYLNQANEYKLEFNNYFQALTAIILHENGQKENALALLNSLKERALTDKNGGMYWRKENGWRWYQAPVETEVAILEAFDKTGFDKASVDKMKIWLLEQKRIQRWATPSATAEAVYALLLVDHHPLEQNNPPVTVTWGDELLSPEKTEAGTGYFKITKTGTEITPELANISVKNNGENIAWGAAYWQYFQDMDKITASGKGLTVEKQILIKSSKDGQEILIKPEEMKFTAGDEVYIRLIIKNDQDMEFVSLKDERGTGMEIVHPLSGYTYSSGIGYYRNNRDAATLFYFRYLPKGTYVIEYPVFLTQKGIFPVGTAVLQSMYAPEFSAHSKGFKITVE